MCSIPFDASLTSGHRQRDHRAASNERYERFPHEWAAHMTSERPLAGIHVLVIEDELVLAVEMVDKLEALGAVALGPITTVAKALRFIETADRFDAALLNVMLCSELSFPVADELRARGIPFVFVTGFDRDVRKRFPEVPVHPKPADMAAIVVTLAAVIAENARRPPPAGG